MTRRTQGFTLLEMSIVLAIIAVVVGGGAVMFAASLAQQQDEETRGKLAVLQKALLDYRRAFNRLPCPANATLAITNVNFGVEGATRGTCTGGTPAANYTSGNIVEGMVPVTTLGLANAYGLDGWNSRILYAVDKTMTADDAFTTVTITDATTRITVDGAAGGNITPAALYVLLSTGANRHGAFPRAGGSTRVSVASTNINELENCDCNTNGTYNALNTTFVQRMSQPNTDTVTNVFDDLVVFGTRADLRSLTE